MGRRVRFVRLVAATSVIVSPSWAWSPVAAAPDASIETVDPEGDNWSTSLALDANGNPVISYTNYTDGTLRLAHCNDPNCAGDDDPITIVDAAGDTWRTALVLDSSGHPVIAFYGTEGELRLAHCNDPNCAGDDDSIATVDTSSGNSESNPSLVLDAAGHPVIAYHDNGPPVLRLAHCNDPDCVGDDETLTTVDTIGDVGFRTTLVLDAAGNPVIAYDADSDGQLRVAHCNDPDCAGDDDSITIAGSSALPGALVLDATGNPVIAYTNYVDNETVDLRVLHCNDPDCAGSDDSNIAIDPGSGFVEDPSLVLDSSGNPVISYHENRLRHLRLVHCNDPDCTGDDETLATVDANDNTGFTPSLRLDVSGSPVISYAEGTTGALLLAHCDDPDCTSADDTVAPTINTPDMKITVTAASATADTAVTFEISATDDHDGDVPVTCDRTSGSEFLLGTTTVTCTATDSSGNTAISTFEVVVQAPTPVDTLPATGNSTTTSLWVAVLLVALGGSLLAVPRRHRVQCREHGSSRSSRRLSDRARV